MSDSSDMSADNDSQSSDVGHHHVDPDPQLPRRAATQGFFDDAAAEQGESASSEHSSGQEEDQDEDDDSNGSSGSDSETDAPNKRSRHADSGRGPRGPRGPNRMFGASIVDDMAEEDSAESEYEDSSRNKTQYSFTQFKRLPLEIRQRIWEVFCPDLTVKARFYEFRFISSSRDYRYGPASAPEVWEGPALSQQTEAARRVLAVHQESRRFALRQFPDELSLRAGRGIVRFHSERDVVHVSGITNYGFGSGVSMPALPKFSDRVRHLAVESELWPVLEPMTDQLLSVFPNLQHAYFLIDYSETSAKDMLWAADGKRLCHYHYETCEETTGVGEDAIYRWVWPDLTTQEGKEVAERYSKSAKLGKFSESDPSGKEEAAGLKIWPLLDFSQPRGEEAFQHLLSWAKNGETDVKWPDEPEGDADGSSGEEDDYESSGIDDDPIEQHDDSEESENDLLVVEGSDSSQEDEDDDDDEDEDQEGPGADRTHISAHDPDTFAGFSSPEPSSPATAQGKSNDGSGSDRPSSPPPRSTLKRARGRVVDSDSENNSEDEENNAPRKRARTNLRKRASMSDSEDSEAESEQEPSSPPPRSRRRAPGARTTSRGNLVIQPDDDSSEEERKMRKNAKLLHPELEDDSHSPSDFSSDSESDDQEEEEEEDDKPSRPLTLAEKLAQHRNENPIPSDDEERDYNEFDDEYEYGGTGIDADPMEGTDYDARQYADLEDDEEGHNEDEGLGERPEEDYGRGYGEPEMEPLFDDGEDYGEGGEW